MKFKNLPNILTVIRIFMVPVFMVIMLFPLMNDMTTRIVGAVLFALISFTDMLDGKIARKYNIVSDFGKFLDPIADKLLVFGAMISLLVYMGTPFVIGGEFTKAQYIFAVVMAFALFIQLLREFLVTGLRMSCKSSGGAVIAANMAGKIKTVSQMIFVIAALIEPLIWSIPAVTYVCLAIMTVMTVYSGANYFKIYLPLMKSDK